MQKPQTCISLHTAQSTVIRNTAMPDPYISSSPPAASSATRQRRRRRRHLLFSPFSAAARTSPSAASSSPASSAGPSLFSFSRSPSPLHHRFLSPLHAASAVPFAWERRPGVPKTPERQSRANSNRAAAKALAPPPLPLPPSRLLYGSKICAANESFSVASAASEQYCFIVPKKGARERLGRRVRREPALAAATLTDCLAVLSLCQSCTLSRDCLAGTPQRPRAMSAKAVVGWSG